jgi:hypothetical protein
VAIVQLGKLQQRIWRVFTAKPDAEISTSELVALAFPRLRPGELKRSHWYSVRRAAGRVAVRVGRVRPSGAGWVSKQSQMLPSVVSRGE